MQKIQEIHLPLWKILARLAAFILFVVATYYTCVLIDIGINGFTKLS